MDSEFTTYVAIHQDILTLILHGFPMDSDIIKQAQQSKKNVSGPPACSGNFLSSDNTQTNRQIIAETS